MDILYIIIPFKIDRQICTGGYWLCSRASYHFSRFAHSTLFQHDQEPKRLQSQFSARGRLPQLHTVFPCLDCGNISVKVSPNGVTTYKFDQFVPVQAADDGWDDDDDDDDWKQPSKSNEKKTAKDAKDKKATKESKEKKGEAKESKDKKDGKDGKDGKAKPSDKTKEKEKEKEKNKEKDKPKEKAKESKEKDSKEPKEKAAEKEKPKEEPPFGS